MRAKIWLLFDDKGRQTKAGVEPLVADLDLDPQGRAIAVIGDEPPVASLTLARVTFISSQGLMIEGAEPVTERSLRFQRWWVEPIPGGEA